jgi:outer membrane protein assembly factor BamB
MDPMRIAVFAACLLFAAPLHADDWPQFLGPQRNGVSKETGLRAAWSKDGPPKLWSKVVGEGFSGPVVAGDRLILFHRIDNEEVVECLHAETGKAIWKQGYATSYEDQLGKGNGPRSTPVIQEGMVVTLGAAGMLTCFELATGKKQWTHDLAKEYRVAPSYFGVGTSPLIDKDRVLVNVGGKAGGIVAFALDGGKELWKATQHEASYSSPVLTTIDGAKRALFFTREGPVLLDPADGSVKFQQKWRARYAASVNAATPLIIGDLAFLSASYETGALLLKLRADGADEVWRAEEGVMSNHYNTCVYHDGHLYGIDGRQEAGPNLRCVDLKTKKVLWEKERFGCGTMVLAEAKLILLTERGELLLIDATPAGYRELARAMVLTDGPCRAQIGLANGRLYARDQKTLTCFDLKK